MSDLAATNCGGCSSTSCNSSGSNCIWIILILLLYGGLGNNDGCSSGLLGNGCGCDAIVWILLLSCFCGSGNCGCGC